MWSDLQKYAIKKNADLKNATLIFCSWTVWNYCMKTMLPSGNTDNIANNYIATVCAYVGNNPIFGNMKMEWTFPENMDQEDMIQNINKGIENKLSSMYDGVI